MEGTRILAGRLAEAMPFLRRSEPNSTEKLSDITYYRALRDPGPPINPICDNRASHVEHPKKSMVHVHLQKPQDIKCLQYSESTEVKDLLQLLSSRVSCHLGGCLRYHALCLVHVPSGKRYWLHRNLTMRQVHKKYMSRHPREEWKFFLRVRYFPRYFEDMAADDSTALLYLQEQLKEQFFEDEREDFDFAVAIRLACLEMRKMYNDMHSFALEKKSNFDNIHLEKLIPRSVLNRTKTKLLRKHIQQIFRLYSEYDCDRCALEFLKELVLCKNFRDESFNCDIGSRPAIPAEIVVGPEIGIAYRRTSSEHPCRVAHLHEIVSIRVAELQSARFQVHLSRVDGEPVILTFNYPEDAESLADLVDGYHRLLKNTEASIWLSSNERKILLTGDPGKQRGLRDSYQPLFGDWDSSLGYGSTAELIDDDGDYSMPAGITKIVFKEGHMLSPEAKQSVLDPVPSRRTSETSDEPPTKPPKPGSSTYLIARTPEVLTELMRENSSRLSQAIYDAPATPFNTVMLDSPPGFWLRNTNSRDAPTRGFALSDASGSRWFSSSGAITDETQLQLEKVRLESRLKKQMEESQNDNEWLAEKETTLEKCAGVPVRRSRGSTASDDREEMGKPLATSNIVVKVLEPSPTAELDRQNDDVYSGTINVVKAVMRLNKGVQHDKLEMPRDYVLDVGKNLRDLLGAVDAFVDQLQGSTAKEIKMAQTLLGEDMKKLVSALTLVEKYGNTTLEQEYVRSMISSAHVLAVDVKNLQDAVDNERLKVNASEFPNAQKQAEVSEATGIRLTRSAQPSPTSSRSSTVSKRDRAGSIASSVGSEKACDSVADFAEAFSKEFGEMSIAKGSDYDAPPGTPPFPS
ncbi:unnamed protein product [Notodromas monacha]|uniref:FERM domain-containing protein n=1 Tax=Notodromas monacha TaxID=399045 RepID=A0A7R9BPT5_9CRUS|nr:unnamed protein product [Notodromas monacha]CAG0918596.1 unnamed protein product [Notodromas monacha]